MRLELIDDKNRIRLCFTSGSIEDAVKYITKQIRGEGKWKSLAGLDPSTLKIRIGGIYAVYTYYDLNGEYVGLNKWGERILANLESLRIDVNSECQYRDPTGGLREKYERANEMLDECIETVRRAWREE